MPVQRAGGGWRWGQHGKVYASRADAIAQGRAAYAGGYHGNSELSHRVITLEFDESLHPRDDAGRFASGGGGGGSSDNITTAEKEIRRKSKEYAFIFKDGKEIYRSAGSGKEVLIPDVPAGSVILHNHPGGGPPTPEDMLIGMDQRVSELRVVTAGRTFSIRPPEGGWDKIKNPEGLKRKLTANVGKVTWGGTSDWAQLAVDHGFLYDSIKESYASKDK